MLESPREGGHTHSCLKCKKLEELRQTVQAAKNPERTYRYMRAQCTHVRVGSADAALTEKPAKTPDTPTLPQGYYIDLPSTNTPQHPLRKTNNHPKKITAAEARPRSSTVSRAASAAQHPKVARTKEGASRPRASGPKSCEEARGASTVYPGRLNPVAQHISGGRREDLPSKRG